MTEMKNARLIWGAVQEVRRDEISQDAVRTRALRGGGDSGAGTANQIMSVLTSPQAWKADVTGFLAYPAEQPIILSQVGGGESQFACLLYTSTLSCQGVM